MIQTLVTNLISFGILIGFSIWFYWSVVWQALNVRHLHIISTRRYYALGIGVEIFILVLSIAIVCLLIAGLSARHASGQMIRTIVTAIGIAASAVVINQGLFTSRGLGFKIVFYLVGSILSLEASILLNLKGGVYARAAAPEPVPAGIAR